MADFVDVLAGGDNPSGTKQVFYYAPISTFATIGAPGGLAAAELADVAVISDDHAFETGGRFWKLELEMNKNEFNGEFQGAIRGNADKNVFSGLVPNLSPSILGILRKLRNERLIVLIPLADGQHVQLGEANNPAMLQANLGSGVQEGGERGATVTVTSYGYSTLYTGAISFTPAS